MKSPKPYRAKFSSKRIPLGQGLSEYSLALSLMAVVSLGALGLFGTNAAGLLGDMRHLFSAKKITSVAVVSSAPATQPSPSSNNNSNPPLPTTPLVPRTQTCYSTGWCLNLSQNQANEIKKPQVAGANGWQMLNNQTDVLLQIAQQAGQDPTMDPSLKDLLTQLANSGHTTANSLNAALQDYTNYWTVTEKRTNYDTPAADAAWADFCNYFDTFTDASGSFSTLKSKVLTYLKNNPNTLPSDVQQIIQNASSSIENQTKYMGYEPNNAIDTMKWGKAWETTPAATTGIHQNSNTICTNGGNTQVCVQ